MRTKAVQIIALLFGVVGIAALQDAAPVWCGVKPPLVAVVTAFAALRLPLAPACAQALVTGLFADALSSLPAYCLASFLPLAVLVVRLVSPTLEDLPPFARDLVLGVSAAALGEVWLSLHIPLTDTGLVIRISSAILLALPLHGIVCVLWAPLARFTGLEAKA